MASYDGVSLPLDAAGAVLQLQRRSVTDWVETFADGAAIRLIKDSTAVIATIVGHCMLGDLPVVAREYADRALDLIAARSGGAYALADATSPHVCWHPGAEGATMRVWVETQSQFSMTAGGGPTAYPLVWHESMRYFRASQTATDLFDGFRNLYLALESLMSYVEPVRQKPNGRYEAESDWTKRALSVAEQRLAAFNRALVMDKYLAVPPKKAPVEEVYDELYTTIRTAIFHAKNNRPYVLPQDRAGRKQVEDALVRYASLWTDLAEAVFGARFLRSGLSPAGFDTFVDALVPGWIVGLLGQTFEVAEYDADAAADLVTLPTQRDESRDEAFRVTVVGQARTADLGAVPAIRSIVVRNSDGEPVLVEGIGGSLLVDGVETLQCHVAFHITGTDVKRRYET